MSEFNEKISCHEDGLTRQNGGFAAYVRSH